MVFLTGRIVLHGTVRVLRNVYRRVGCPQPHWYLYVLRCISGEPAPMIMEVGRCMISRGCELHDQKLHLVETEFLLKKGSVPSGEDQSYSEGLVLNSSLVCMLTISENIFTAASRCLDDNSNHTNTEYCQQNSLCDSVPFNTSCDPSLSGCAE